MSSYVTAASKAGDLFLERIAAYQEMWLKSITMLNKYVLPSPPMARPDYSTSIEVTKANFDFLERLLAQHKEFAESLYSFVQPKPASAPRKKTGTRARTRAKPTAQKARKKTSRSKAQKTPPGK